MPKKKTIAGSLRFTAEHVRTLETLIDGIIDVNANVTVEIDENIRPALRRLKSSIASAQKLIPPEPTIIVDAE